MNKGVIIGGAIGLAVVAFIAGAFLGPQIMRATGIGGATTIAGPGGRNGGPMANLTDAERQQLQNMTDEQRQQFFAEKMGGQAARGRPERSRSRWHVGRR